MSDRDPYVQTQALIALALVLFAGTAVAIWTPFGFSLLLGSVALLRICWIEDNIHQDLLEADRVPAGYRATQRRRATVLGAE